VAEDPKAVFGWRFVAELARRGESPREHDLPRIDLLRTADREKICRMLARAVPDIWDQLQDIGHHHTPELLAQRLVSLRATRGGGVDDGGFIAVMMMLMQ